MTQQKKIKKINTMTGRQAKLMIILGYNGTGKTTLLKKIIQNEINKGGRALIITPDDIEFNEYKTLHLLNAHTLDFTGGRRIIFQESYTLQNIHHFTKGLLVFDDCRAYLKSTTDEAIHNLLIRRRQRQIDIVAVGHGFTEVPPKFFTFASEIILFETKDNIYSRKTVIKDFEKMQKSQEAVNKLADKNPHIYDIIKQ